VYVWIDKITAKSTLDPLCALLTNTHTTTSSGSEDVISTVAKMQLLSVQTVEDEKITKVSTSHYTAHSIVFLKPQSASYRL
jgi:hypothetical protein